MKLSRFLTANRFEKNLPAAVLLVLAILAFTSFWFWNGLRTSSPHPLPAHAADSATTSPAWPLDVMQADNFSGPDSSSRRAVYPYSVIPGGVINATELKAAMRQDPEVAAHYADFRMRFTRRIRLATARHVYVSYRLGDHIYWTRKKIALRAGELLLTDGKHLARTRCGNRLSEVPAGPVSPSEPPVEILNKPIVWNLPVLTLDPQIGAPIWPDTSPPQLTLHQPPQPGGTPFIPLLPIFPCCGASGGPSPSSNPSPSPPTPPGPPIATPEPAPIVLLIVGLGGVLCLRRFLRS